MQKVKSKNGCRDRGGDLHTVFKQPSGCPTCTHANCLTILRYKQFLAIILYSRQDQQFFKCSLELEFEIEIEIKGRANVFNSCHCFDFSLMKNREEHQWNMVVIMNFHSCVGSTNKSGNHLTVSLSVNTILISQQSVCILQVNLDSFCNADIFLAARFPF